MIIEKTEWGHGYGIIKYYHFDTENQDFIEEQEYPVLNTTEIRSYLREVAHKEHYLSFLRKYFNEDHFIFKMEEKSRYCVLDEQ